MMFNGTIEIATNNSHICHESEKSLPPLYYAWFARQFLLKHSRHYRKQQPSQAREGIDIREMAGVVAMLLEKKNVPGSIVKELFEITPDGLSRGMMDNRIW